MYNEESKKLAYEGDPQQGNALNGAAGSVQGGTPYRPPTLRESAEKSVEYHREQADKSAMALAFFRAHPEFDEFVRLVRLGSIQF